MNIKRKFDEEESAAVPSPPAPDEEERKEGDMLFTEAAVPVHFTREDIHISNLASQQQGGQRQGQRQTGEAVGGGSSSPLEWLGGSVVNIGDVNGIALLASHSGVEMIAVVGEGIQVFRRKGAAK